MSLGSIQATPGGHYLSYACNGKNMKTNSLKPQDLEIVYLVCSNAVSCQSCLFAKNGPPRGSLASLYLHCFIFCVWERIIIHIINLTTIAPGPLSRNILCVAELSYPLDKSCQSCPRGPNRQRPAVYSADL